jgi:hypothetical protein
MFLQDVQHLVPVSSRQERETYFELETNDKPLAIKVMAALDRQYHSRHFADALSDFLSSTATELFYEGQIIIDLKADYTDFEWKVTSLKPSASQIASIGPLLVQFLPERENSSFGEDLKTLPSEIRILDQKTLLRIELPANLKRLRTKLLKRLDLLSGLAYPDIEKLFPRTSLENPNPRSNAFDFFMFKKNFDVALFQTIRETGWMARDYTGDEKSDFLTSVWRLRFRKLQASLRMDIIRQLNEQIPKIIRHFNPDFEMAIMEQGMLTPADLDDMERQLYEGEISFKEVIDSTFNR